MGRFTLIELLHIAAGLAGTLLITKLSAWAYPLGRETIWTVGYLSAAVVALMGIRPLRRALARDRGEGGA